jgi:hypothetical protein
MRRLGKWAEHTELMGCSGLEHNSFVEKTFWNFNFHIYYILENISLSIFSEIS